MGSIYIQVTQCLSGYGCDDHESLEALRDDCNYYEQRPASPSDLISALQSEGVGAVERRCDAHDDVSAWKNPDVCRAGVKARDGAACVMYSVLVVRIEEGET